MNIFYLPLILLLPTIQIESAPLDDDAIFDFDADILLDDVNDGLSSDDGIISNAEEDVVQFFGPGQRETVAARYDDVTVDDGNARRKRATILVVGDATYYVQRRIKPRRKFRPSPLLG